MYHSSMFVSLLIVAGLSTVYSQKPCEKRRGWGGICFGTQTTLSNVDSCESIVPWSDGVGDGAVNGCPEDESCCVNCNKQTKYCHKSFAGSVGMNKFCNRCPSMWRVGEVRSGSGCFCCKDCKRKDWCRRQSVKGGPHSYCVTNEDPDPEKSVAGCEAKGWRVKLRGCKGNGCHCCAPPTGGDPARL